MNFLHNFVLSFIEIKLLTLLDNVHESLKHGCVLCVAPFLFFANLVQQVYLPIYLFGQVVFEVLVLSLFIKFSNVRFRNHLVELLSIRICKFDCFNHLGEDNLAKLKLCEISQREGFNCEPKPVRDFFDRACFLAQK